MQDVAQKVLAYAVPFSNDGDLARFANHVAEHLRIDALRKERRRRTDLLASPDAELEDWAEPVIEAVTASQAWAQLSEPDRRVLLASAEPADQAEYRRRSRARARLLKLLAALEGWLGWLRLRARHRSMGFPISAAALVVVVGTLMTLHTPPAHTVDRGEHTRAMGHVTNRKARAPLGTGELRSAAALRRASPTYHERVSLPPYHLVVSAGAKQLVVVDGRPTQAHDPIVCVHRMPVVGTHCVGDATELRIP